MQTIYRGTKWLGLQMEPKEPHDGMAWEPIWLQLSVASLTDRPQPKAIITIVIIRLKLWPAAGCEAKVEAEFSSRP